LVKPRNIIDKWNKHVLSWLHYKDKGVTFVRFSDLKNSLETALKAIEANTSQKLKSMIVPVLLTYARQRPDFHITGIKRGQSGVWRDYFTPEDEEFLDRTLSDATKQFKDS